MSVTKKSLISDREVTKKAAIASNAEQAVDAPALKASSVTAHTLAKSRSGPSTLTALKKRKVTNLRYLKGSKA